LRGRANYHSLRAMNLMKERSRAEIILFATAIFGIWLSIWAVILTSVAIDVIAVLIILTVLIIFALRDS
jgi:hypothetical protein